MPPPVLHLVPQPLSSLDGQFLPFVTLLMIGAARDVTYVKIFAEFSKFFGAELRSIVA